MTSGGMLKLTRFRAASREPLKLIKTVAVVGRSNNTSPNICSICVGKQAKCSSLVLECSTNKTHLNSIYPPFFITNRLLEHTLLQNYCKPINNICNFSTTAKKLAEKEDEGSLEVDRKLKILKEELEAGQREAERADAEKKSALEHKKRPLKSRVWQELVHYYHGFRLFFLDIKVSVRLLSQVFSGHALSRPEKMQLVRSVADIMRLVPFLVFIIVPFMEFLLPVYLKLFPGALPSTFLEKSMEEQKVRKQLKLKMEMAKFLEETVQELSIERKKKGAADTKVAEFSKFLQTVRHGDGYVSNTQLLKYSKLFEDELTLDNLSEAQLRALCRIVGITPLGTANILRFQLSMKLNELKRDDRMIHKEGVENMSATDLQAACRARGMRALGVSEERLRQQLSQWIELSFNEKVPPSLLLLSRTLFLPEDVSFSDRFKTLMSTLPAHLADEAKLKIAELEGAAELDYKSKFDLVKSVEEIIKREKENKKAMQKAALKIEAQQAEGAAKQRQHDDQAVKCDELPIVEKKLKNGEQPIGDSMNNIALHAKDKKIG